jgi:hypothetical protein
MTDDLNPYGLGGIPSPADPRDFPVELDTATPLPARFLLGGIPTALNQHNTPKCGGYSGAGLKMVQERADTGKFLAFDPDWIYANAQEYDTIPMPHVGTTARGVCKALQKIGPRVKGKPGTEKLYRIASYSSVPWTYDAIKRSIFQYHTPVLIGASWYRSWFHPVKGVIPAPDVHEGGHLFFAWGWDDNVAGGSLLCQNSWGQYAGSVNGRFYAPARYLIPAIHDAWRLVDQKTGA